MQEVTYTFNKSLTNNFRETTEEKEAILNNLMPLKILSKSTIWKIGLNNNLWVIVLTFQADLSYILISLLIILSIFRLIKNCELCFERSSKTDQKVAKKLSIVKIMQKAI